jgi:glyoxylase-like metal-dependent hydrolase (beta-lactamase superfamily II)
MLIWWDKNYKHGPYDWRFTFMNISSSKQGCKGRDIFLLLFSNLVMIAVIQTLDSQPTEASEISEKESDVDNIMLRNNESSSEGNFNATSFPRIHNHMSGEKGIFANAYLIESINGVVAVDSSLTVSESKALRSKLDSINKPLLAIILTHPHPDHVAGVTNLITSPQVPIISLESVAKEMHATEEAKRIQWTPVYGKEWISKWTYPNQYVKDLDTVTFDGLTYKVYDFGPGGDSNSTSIWILEQEPKIAFVGDLVFNGMHPYIADDHIFDWLKNLDKAQHLFANISIIYPGHGKPGSIDLFESQKKYLLAYSDAIKELSNGNSTLTEDTKKELTQRMEKFLPDAGLSFLIPLSADPVAAELLANK